MCVCVCEDLVQDCREFMLQLFLKDIPLYLMDFHLVFLVFGLLDSCSVFGYLFALGVPHFLFCFETP